MRGSLGASARFGSVKSNQISVRPLASDEIEAVESKLRRYTSETHRHRFDEQQSGQTTYLVAWLDGEPAGYARIKWRPTFMMSLALPNTPSIGDVTVKPDLRSLGIGSQMMAAAEALVASRGFQRLALGVGPDNARAIDFYHRRGYFDSGISPDRSRKYLLEDGEWWQEAQECICLVKQLDRGRRILVVARGKLNLYLRVSDRRADGYHTIETVMQSISLADELALQPSTSFFVSTEWAAGLSGALPDRPDLAERAILMSKRSLAPGQKAAGKLIKRIPIGAGLGGGSADAAAALCGLGAMYQEVRPADVQRRARRLGSDVPFCLHGGTAVGKGLGARLTRVPCKKPLWWVLGLSPIQMPTRSVYQRYDALQQGSGSKPAQLPAPARTMQELLGYLKCGDLGGIAACLHNDLETAAFDIEPRLAGLKNDLSEAGVMGAVMTGSGSAIMGLCESQSSAVEAARKARRRFSRVEVVFSTSQGAEVSA